MRGDEREVLVSEHLSDGFYGDIGVPARLAACVKGVADLLWCVSARERVPSVQPDCRSAKGSVGGCVLRDVDGIARNLSDVVLARIHRRNEDEVSHGHSIEKAVDLVGMLAGDLRFFLVDTRQRIAPLLV